MRILPPDLVALFLASSVVLFILGAITNNVLMFVYGTDIAGYNPHSIDTWHDVLLTVVGGLIGYVGGRGSRGGP